MLPFNGFNIKVINLANSPMEFGYNRLTVYDTGEEKRLATERITKTIYSLLEIGFQPHKGDKIRDENRMYIIESITFREREIIYSVGIDR